MVRHLVDPCGTIPLVNAVSAQDCIEEGSPFNLTPGVIAALREVTEVEDSARARSEYASDASNYRIPPAAVAFPRDADEAEETLRIAREAGIPITSRGAGTSVAGNAIGPGIILDFSRYMNRILDIDPTTRTARVQPGVIMTDLQVAAAPLALWFGPDPSTKNRATFGGMIGNNACGPHALAYGRTADNVVALDVIDGRGRRFTVGRGKGELEKVPGLSTLVDDHLALLRTELGRFTRQVSGYSLEHLLPEKGTDLAKALVGTEGTCVTIVEATVRLTPVPTRPVLVVLGYDSMVEAAEDVVRLLPLHPLAIEGMDSRLVDVVRHHSTAPLPDLPPGKGWLFCEVGEEEGDPRSAALRALDLVGASDCRGHRIVIDPQETAALWRIRADGVGLAGRTPSGKQAWPGWEDAAVPPAQLGPYLRDFDALMEKYGVEGLPYGHFGDGCIHVRIGLPLDNEADTRTFGAFMEEAAALVGQYGGSISGEHGDGRARSALLPSMYSAEALALFAQFKGLFDPNNLLNPGVLVDPAPLTSALRRPHARPLAAKGFAFTEDNGDFTAAVHRCVGVGKCRADNFGVGGFMCPSYQASKDEKNVTRGRSRVLQDMTRGVFSGEWSSPEVAESLDLCLSCKACGTDCPAGVDMSMYKSEVTYQRYRGKVRPMNHYALGWLPQWARMVTAVPGIATLANALLKFTPLRTMVFTLAGLDPRREMTAFTNQRFSRWFRRNAATDVVGEADAELPGDGTENTIGLAPGHDWHDDPDEFALAIEARLNPKPAPRNVVIWADSFSEYLDPTAAESMVKVLQDAGYTVRIPSGRACCGLTWISTGQLDGAKKRLRGVLDILGPAAMRGVPIIGVEPSCTAVLRSDLAELLPDDPRAVAVAARTMTLAELLTDPVLGPEPKWWQRHSLTGTTVVAQPHCHQHAVMGYHRDMDLLTRLGAQVTPLAGCCGLAGNFGMEKGHYDLSVAVANNALLPALDNAPEGAVYLADGYSCRTQAEQLANVTGIALPTLLDQARISPANT